MSLRAQAARGLKWQAIEIGGRQVLSLVVFTTLARLLSPAAFGLVGLVGVYLAFVGIFVDQGIGTALVQRKVVEAGHLNSAFWFNLACAALLCLGTMLAANSVSRTLLDPQLAPLLRWASLALIINAAAAVHSALFVRAMDFRKPALRTLLANVIGGIVGVGMALGGCGVWALIGQQLAAALAGCAFLWTTSPWRPTGWLSKRHLGQLIGISSSIFITDFLWFFSCRIDQIVIGRFAGPSVLGQYVVGGKLPGMATLGIHKPLAAVSLPALSRLQADDSRMCQVIYKGMEANAVASFAAFGGLAAVANTLVPLVFGPQWQGAAAFLQLAALYGLVRGLLVFIHPAMISAARPGTYAMINALLACGSAIACVIGIRYGAYAVILGLIANQAGQGMVQVFVLRREMGLSFWLYWRPCIAPMVAATAMTLAVFGTRHSVGDSLGAVISLVAQVAVGAAVYLGVLAVVEPRRVLALWVVAQQAFGRGESSLRTHAALTAQG